MKKDSVKVSRRQLIKGTVGSAFFINVASGSLAWANEELKESDPVAVALSYRADASAITTEEFPSFEPGQRCGSCVQFQGKEGESNGGCAIFPGKTVASAGWCKVWAK